MPWQAQFEDLRTTAGVAWYQRTFSVDPATRAAAGLERAILHFGAVDYSAQIWLNGALIGEHEGGYLPFEFDVSDALREGENQLLVRVEDPTDDWTAFPDYRFSEVPHGKQSWYGPIGGIWQSVWLAHTTQPVANFRHSGSATRAGEAWSHFSSAITLRQRSVMKGWASTRESPQ
jgi:beta-galactosidase/beta-glucuronidase